MACFVRQLSTKQFSKALCFTIQRPCISKLKVIRSFSMSSTKLKNIRFSDKHEWVITEGKFGTVGVSNYAQEALGDVVFVQTPEVGQQIAKNDEAGVIESVKAVNEIYSPVSGTVTEINTGLVDQPSLINTSCYDKGWIFKLELSDPSEVESLLDEENYDKYLKSID